MAGLRGSTRPRGGAPLAGSELSFDEAVAEAVKGIPRGMVLSYSQVAARAGKPRAARAVAGALRRSPELPWWRVIRADGTLAGAVADEQARRLQREGVEVDGLRVVGARLLRSR